MRLLYIATAYKGKCLPGDYFATFADFDAIEILNWIAKSIGSRNDSFTDAEHGRLREEMLISNIDQTKVCWNANTRKGFSYAIRTQMMEEE